MLILLELRVKFLQAFIMRWLIQNRDRSHGFRPAARDGCAAREEQGEIGQTYPSAKRGAKI